MNAALVTIRDFFKNINKWTPNLLLCILIIINIYVKYIYIYLFRFNIYTFYVITKKHLVCFHVFFEYCDLIKFLSIVSQCCLQAT